MAERQPSPSVDIEGSFLGKVNSGSSFQVLHTFENLPMNIIFNFFHILQIDPSKSYSLDLYFADIFSIHINITIIKNITSNTLQSVEKHILSTSVGIDATKSNFLLWDYNHNSSLYVKNFTTLVNFFKDMLTTLCVFTI